MRCWTLARGIARLLNTSAKWTLCLTVRALRSHQQQLAAVVAAIASGRTDARDILAAVTPGGGKSLLPVLAAAALKQAGLIDRICWGVPRDSLRLQAEEAFADPAWRMALGHALSVRAAENAPNPSRGLDGYVTTYQGVAAAPDLHLAEFRRHRTLLVIDEMHHLPALADSDPDTAAQLAAAGTASKRAPGDGPRDTPRAAPGGAPGDAQDDADASRWSCAILPLLECATVRLLLSGTLERADGKGILWLPYRRGPRIRTREIALDAPGWLIVGYS